MAFVKKTWKNRVSEFFNRYRVENVQTGAVSKVYMNLDDGVVTQEGDVVDADTMNDLEDRIENGFNETYKSTDSAETSIDDADYIPFYDSSAQAMKKIAVSDAEFGGGGAEVYIAGVESTSTASQAYTVGQYLVYNGFLYKVISAIAQGDTLVIGTNISVTTVGNEITNANTAITNANTAMNRIRTYVGSDSKLHFTDATGADSVLPFSSGLPEPIKTMVEGGFKLTTERSRINGLGNRWCTKNTTEKAVIYHDFDGRWGGWGIAGLTSTSVQCTAGASNSNTNYSTYTTPSGTTIYFGYQSSKFEFNTESLSAVINGQTMAVNAVGIRPFILPVCAYLLGVK